MKKNKPAVRVSKSTKVTRTNPKSKFLLPLIAIVSLGVGIVGTSWSGGLFSPQKAEIYEIRSPRSLVPSSPVASGNPITSLTCRTEVYRIPGSTTLSTLTAGDLTKYKINPTTTIANPAKQGEIFAFNLVLLNTLPGTGYSRDLKLESTILSGNNLPYQMLKLGKACRAEMPGKTIYCQVPGLNLGPDVVRPETFTILKITSNAYNKETTKLGYSGKYGDTNLSCPQVEIKIGTACKPRPACLDAVGRERCNLPETEDMCPVSEL